MMTSVKACGRSVELIPLVRLCAQIPTPQPVAPLEVYRFGPEEWLPLLNYYHALVRRALPSCHWLLQCPGLLAWEGLACTGSWGIDAATDGT